MNGETSRRFLGDLAETHLDPNDSNAARLGIALDTWVRERDRTAPVQRPDEADVELRVTLLIGPMKLPTYAAKLTSSDVNDLTRRLLGP